METRTLLSALRRPDDDGSPDSSFTTRLTPDSDSEDGLDLDHAGAESYELRDVEKSVPASAFVEENNEEEDREENDHIRRRASVSTVQSYQLYTPDEERAVVRKFDRKLVLFVALLYMLSFLDRSSMWFLSGTLRRPS